jgi:hypothetical protein
MRWVAAPKAFHHTTHTALTAAVRRQQCVPKTLNPTIVVMQSTEDAA